MGHFMFWAGYAYDRKVEVDALTGVHKRYAPKDVAKETAAQSRSPEFWGWVWGTHSAYSYEDLPSNALGPEFGTNVFDQKTSKNLGEQIALFINRFDPVALNHAPNYSTIPVDEATAIKNFENSAVDTVERNYSFSPMYVSS